MGGHDRDTLRQFGQLAAQAAWTQRALAGAVAWRTRQPGLRQCLHVSTRLW